MNRTSPYPDKAKISTYFNSLKKVIFTKKDLSSALAKMRTRQTPRAGENIAQSIAHLQKLHLLRTIELECPRYGHSFTRYIWGPATPVFSVALSLKSKSYLSHQSALYIHGLISQPPKLIYINAEQSIKPRGASSLSQEGIDRAFQRPARKSNFIFQDGSIQLCFLNGMNTRNLGVERTDFHGETLLVTNIARTLIDATVRPGYAGGCTEVLNAFKNAKGRIAVDQLLAILKRIKYIYPYHQAIGFYLQKAGFDETGYNELKKLGLKYNFYLDYALKDKAFSKEWRIYYPKQL